MKSKRTAASVPARRARSRSTAAHETFGSRLRRYRNRMKYTLAALATDAGTDPLTLRRFEWDGGADTVPDMRLGLRLATALAVHPYRLAFGTDVPLVSESPRFSAELDDYEARAAAEDAQRASKVLPIR
jgi:transcriptional regulator with XRE-family HTH domain